MRVADRMHLLAAWAIALGAACAGETGPSRAVLDVSMASTVEGRLVACETCQDGAVVAVEVSATVSDPNGPGGVVARVTAVVVNRSRSVEVARNVRPNADQGLAATTLPPNGQLVVQAGVVAPLPPPRDDVVLTVTVALTDGREATASARLVVSS
jgi:hypothetical protein